MTKMYAELLKSIESEGTHTKVTGWRSKLDAADMLSKGILSIIATSKGMTAEGTAEGESNDLQAEGSGEAEIDGEDLMLDND